MKLSGMYQHSTLVQPIFDHVYENNKVPWAFIKEILTRHTVGEGRCIHLEGSFTDNEYLVCVLAVIAKISP